MRRRGILFTAPLVLASVFMIAGCFEYQAKVANVRTGVKSQDLQISRRPTTIQIQYPTPGSATTNKEISVVAAVNAGEPIAAVTLSVNGNPVERFDAAVKSGEWRNRIPIEVVAPLSLGENRITVTADTGSGETVSQTVAVERNEPAATLASKAIAQRWAVVVGISDYLYSGRGLTPLQFADRDATEFWDFLHSPQGGGFAPAHTKLLMNEQATTRNIRAGLYSFLKRAEKDDLVVIYFAGHGAPEPGRPDNLYLVTYDTDPNDLASTAFPMWDMETALKRYIVADRVVIIADACHSGGIGGEGGLRSVGNANLINTYLANLQKTKPGRAIITASEANQLSREGDEWEGHGVFTYFLLKGLKGDADSDGNGVVTISESFNYVYNKVRRATNSQQHPNIQGSFDRNLPLGVTK